MNITEQKINRTKSKYKIIIHSLQYEYRVPYGLVVRILAFHAGGPGSIPGVGRFFSLS